MSVLVVLKSPLVDVEDFDREVGAGAGKLGPRALPLDFTLCPRPSIFLVVVVTTYATSPGPPAEPLDCQRVALSVKGYVMKGNNGILLRVTVRESQITNTHTTTTTVPPPLLKDTAYINKEANPFIPPVFGYMDTKAYSKEGDNIRFQKLKSFPEQT